MPRTAKRPTPSTSVGGSGQSAAPVTAARVQPITVPTGGNYGEAKALADAQRQLPLPGVQSPGVPVPQSPQAGGADASSPFAAALAAAQADTTPPIGLGNPTDRPNEPITAGIGNVTQPSPQTLGELLTRLAAQNPDLATVAAWANGGRR